MREGMIIPYYNPVPNNLSDTMLSSIGLYLWDSQAGYSVYAISKNPCYAIRTKNGTSNCVLYYHVIAEADESIAAPYRLYISRRNYNDGWGANVDVIITPNVMSDIRYGLWQSAALPINMSLPFQERASATNWQYQTIEDYRNGSIEPEQYPIIYIPVNSTLSGPESAASGDTVSVDVTYPDGYIYQERGISVYDTNGAIAHTYDPTTGKLTFTMP